METPTKIPAPAHAAATPEIVQALRDLVAAGAAPTQRQVFTLQALIWDAAEADEAAVGDLVLDLAYDLAYDPVAAPDGALGEITRALQAIEAASDV
ncbi:hypothetical protein G5B46_17930 [Caulobacter sp. 602-2]|uniref:Uncharacterized protein n=1 Tax=Caulobacter sp. 602-2 TaxID=2710887 RepID=A0A6G4R1N8_9CAUL|nr:hypothetical protein [Caulobacter sp. 602-2]NGM51494.1 hypothetical protein [Caulobacter sp. 602-2]